MVHTSYTIPGHPRSRIGHPRPRQRLRTFTNQHTIRYTFNERGDGRLDSCGSKITVYKYKGNAPPVNLSHPNILDIYFNDIGNKTTVGARKGLQLRRWLKTKRKPITRYCVDDVNKKPKATSIRVYFRGFCGDLLKAVWYINEEGFAIKNLNAKNLCVVNEVIKLCKLEVVPTSNEALKQNLTSVHSIIFKILQESKRNVPEDMMNLLDLLKSSSATKESTVSHPALMLPVERLSMVRELFEKKWNESNSWSNAAKIFFTKADLDDWNIKLHKKMIGHVLNCYNFRSSKKPYRVKVDPTVQRIDVVEDFLNFLRNLSYHVGEGGKVRRLSKKRMDAIIFWAFGKEILLFKECLKQK